MTNINKIIIGNSPQDLINEYDNFNYSFYLQEFI